MGQSISLSRTNDRPNDNHGLVLYYHPFSFYSQKVLFVLHEKNIPCTLYEVDVANGEQFSDWFIHMNPKLDIPVLRNGPLIVPSSNQIICYLDANFNSGEHDLYPAASAKRLNEIVSVNRKISRLPIGIISLGTFIHSSIVSRPKLPFIGPLRNRFLQTEINMMDTLIACAAHDPIHRDALLHKVKLYKDKLEMIRSPEQFQKLIDAVDGMLADIELHLERQFQASNEWLCGDQFTVADISFGMLLHRLHMLGLAKHFWGSGKPYLAQYYRRVAARESFKRSLPSKVATCKAIWYKIPVHVKLCTCSITAIVCGITVYRILV